MSACQRSFHDSALRVGSGTWRNSPGPSNSKPSPAASSASVSHQARRLAETAARVTGTVTTTRVPIARDGHFWVDAQVNVEP